MAHPCLAETAASSSGLTLHTGGNWAGYLPTLADLSHECADDLGALEYQSDAQTVSDPVPGVPAGPIVSAAGFAIKNLTALGHSARTVPLNGTGSSVYNSDLAFKDNLVIAGTYEGFRILDVTNKSNPVQIINYTGCNVGQGDVVVYGNILVRSWDSEVSAQNAATSVCAGQPVGVGFEGFHVFDISDPTAPKMIKQVKFADNEIPAGRVVGCGSHTATALPDPARDALYIYNGGSSGNCPGIDIFKIKISDPTNVTFIKRAEHGRTGNSCHDNNVLMNVGGTTTGYAMCAGGNGLAMFKFDLALDPAAAGGVENPTLLWSQSMGISTGHSGSFTYDGKYLIFGHEPGGGSAARCQATSTVAERTLFFIDPLTGETKGTMLHPRPQNSRENCTWHNFNVVPTKAGYYATVGSYQSGISVFDFSNPAAPKEIAYADPAPLQNPSNEPPAPGIILGGDWSTYWHNGYIYESDIKRGVTTWQLNLASDATAAQANEHLKRTNIRALSNPQTQTAAYAPDATGAAIDIAGITPGQAFKAGSTFTPTFTCTDAAGVDSCVGTAATGTPVTNTTVGNKVFKVTAIDSAGNITTKEVAYMVNSVDFTVEGGGTVDTVMALENIGSVSFGTFKPGVAQSYLATIAPMVTSTTGDIALTVHDPSTTNVGRLVNNNVPLTTPLAAFATTVPSTAVAAAGGAIGGAAAPTALLSYAAPATRSSSTLTFRQNVAQAETLRQGSYSKTLVFTLSTTAP